MERICRQVIGLFPARSEIRFNCSCPDGLDVQARRGRALRRRRAARPRAGIPLRLRGVDETDLLAGIDTALPLSKTGPVAANVLQTDDISALFGLDMAADEERAASRPSDGPAARHSPSAPKGTAATANVAAAGMFAPRTASAATVPAKPAATRKASADNKIPPKPAVLEPGGNATPGRSAAPKQAVTAKASSRRAHSEKAVTVGKVKGPRRKPTKPRKRTDAQRRPNATFAAAPETMETSPRGRVGLLTSKDKATTTLRPKRKPSK